MFRNRIFCHIVKYANFAFIITVLMFYHDVSKIYEKELLIHSYLPLNQSVRPQRLFTSVWCRGSNHTDRLCRFENLCYYPRIKEFIFLKSHESFMSGLPADRFNPALLDFSSVIDHNRMYFNYVEIPSSKSIDFDVSVYSGCAIILKRFNPDNLMHIFHDDLLPVFYTFKELFLSTCEKTLVFADERPPGNYSFLYENFFKHQPIYLTQLNDHKLFCFSNSFIGLNKYTLWYQYGFKKPQGTLEKNYSGMSNVIKGFTAYFKEQFKITQKKVRPNLAVLLTRGYNRKILNENLLVDAIHQSTDLLQVTSVGLESHNVFQIIELISQCKVLIGMHGSLIVLSMFLPQGSSLIELFPYAIRAVYYTPYQTLVTFPGLGTKYYFWENIHRSNSIPPDNNLAEFGGISHLPVEEQTHIKKTSIVYPPVCCYSAEWLYYIYQDTIVDLPSFLSVLKDSISDMEQFDSEKSTGQYNRLIENNICPGEVRNLTCAKMATNGFNLSWSIPWNVMFLSHTAVQYELWLQLPDKRDVSAYITKKSYFTIAVNHSLSFYVWVRCLSDDCTGPFSNDPTICI